MSEEKARESTSHDTSDRPRSRWGCCLNTIAIGGLIVACLVVFAYQWAKREARENALRMAGTDQVTLDKWLDEPIKVPAEYWKVPPKHSDDFVRIRSKLSEELDNDRNISFIRLADEPLYMAIYSTDTTPTLQKLIDHQDLDTTDTEAITSFTTAMSTYMSRYHDLLGSPEYSFNRRVYVSQSYASGEEQRKLLLPLSSRVAVQAHEGDTSGALATMGMMVQLVKMDVGLTIPSFVAREFSIALHHLSTRTSSSAELRAMLLLMNDSRWKILNRHDRTTFDEPEAPRTIVAMLEDGYIPRLPETRRECLALMVQVPKYHSFLEKKGNARAAELESPRPFYNELPILRVLNVFFGRVYLEMMSEFGNARSYSEERQMTGLTRRLQLQYDMLRLQLARRVARMEGKPVPVKPEDFAPEYMETYPDDPFTTHGLPLGYDTARNEFFSVGEDGASGTSDDLYSGVNEGELPNPLNSSDLDRLRYYMY